MGGMKEVWEKGKLPMMTDDKNILASMEKIKKKIDIKRRNRNLREAIPRKNLVLFGIFPNSLDPPPCIFGTLRRTFLKPYFI